MTASTPYSCLPYCLELSRQARVLSSRLGTILLPHLYLSLLGTNFHLPNNPIHTRACALTFVPGCPSSRIEHQSVVHGPLLPASSSRTPSCGIKEGTRHIFFDRDGQGITTSLLVRVYFCEFIKLQMLLEGREEDTKARQERRKKRHACYSHGVKLLSL